MSDHLASVAPAFPQLNGNSHLHCHTGVTTHGVAVCRIQFCYYSVTNTTRMLQNLGILTVLMLLDAVPEQIWPKK